MFMELLMVQLQHQSIDEPMSSTEIAQQIAQFTSLGQMEELNENMVGLRTDFKSTQLNTAVSLLGKEVWVDGADIQYSEGDVEFQYQLDASSKATEINIKDVNGRLVYVGKGNLVSGEHSYVWDGKDVDGNQVGPGTYTIEVLAQDNSGDLLIADTRVSKVVKHVTADNEDIVLTLEGGQEVSFNDKISITDTKGE